MQGADGVVPSCLLPQSRRTAQSPLAGSAAAHWPPGTRKAEGEKSAGIEGVVRFHAGVKAGGVEMTVARSTGNLY